MITKFELNEKEGILEIIKRSQNEMISRLPNFLEQLFQSTLNIQI